MNNECSVISNVCGLGIPELNKDQRHIWTQICVLNVGKIKLISNYRCWCNGDEGNRRKHLPNVAVHSVTSRWYPQTMPMTTLWTTSIHKKCDENIPFILDEWMCIQMHCRWY